MKYVARLKEYSLNRLALLALLLGSPWLFPQGAGSQTTSVTFTGNVTPSCTISEPTNGSMGLVSSTELSTSGTGGSPATIPVSCNTNTNVQIDTISVTADTSGLTAPVAIATIIDPGGTILVSTDQNNVPKVSVTPYPISPSVFSGDFSVGFALRDDAGLLAGFYSYTVGITFIPN